MKLRDCFISVHTATHKHDYCIDMYGGIHCKVSEKEIAGSYVVSLLNREFFAKHIMSYHNAKVT